MIDKKMHKDVFLSALWSSVVFAIVLFLLKVEGNTSILVMVASYFSGYYILGILTYKRQLKKKKRKEPIAR